MNTNGGLQIELLVANIALAVGYSVIHGVLEVDVDYRTIFVIQVILSAVIFIPIALLNPRRRVISGYDMIRICLCSVVTIYGWNLLTLRSLGQTPPLSMAAISTLSPSVTILAAAISNAWDSRTGHLSRYKLRYATIPTLLLLIISLLIFKLNPLISLQSIPQYGVAICAVCCMGVSTVIAANFEDRYGTTTILASYFAVALLLLPLLIPDFAQCFEELRSLRDKELAATILLPIITLTLPLYLLYRSAQQLTPLHTALYRYVQPLIALGWIVYGAMGADNLASIRSQITELITIVIVTLVLLLISSQLIPRQIIK